MNRESDTVVHEPVALKYMVETIGSRKVTLGSDYPFPLGDLTLGKFIEESDLDTQTKEDIFYNTALEWLDG